ncbi:MAG: hypothetical protein U0996_26060 [Planctomycetaceae bacterium]
MRAIVIIDYAAHKAAERYYNWANIEPIAFGGTVIDSLEIDYYLGRLGLTFFDTVRFMADSLNNGEGAVIVGHGNDHALLLPLTKKTTQKLTRNSVSALNRYLSGTGGKTEDVMASPDIRIKSRTTFLDLCDYIQIVRERNLGHIALRACNLGASGAGFLDELRVLFNCKMISGPMIKDAYVDWNPNNVARSVAHFEEVIKDPRYRQMVIWGTSPNRVAIQTSQTAAQAADHSFSLDSLAESPGAIQKFLEEQFPASKTPQYKPGMTVPIHGLYYKGAVVFPGSDYYARLLITSPAYTQIPLPMYIPPEEQTRTGVLARIRSRIHDRRAAR